MTTKDYTAIAKAIRISKLHTPMGIADTLDSGVLLAELAKYMKADNPLFNSSKFYEACLKTE